MARAFCNVIISAVLYGIAFWDPTLFWWGSVASMVLIMRLPLPSAQKMFVYGFVWGLCVYIMHLYGVIIGVVELAVCRTWYAWLPGIALVFYLALCTGAIWAFGPWCETLVTQRSLRSPCVHAMGNVFWLWLYWLWMTYACLWPLGRCEGYLLANPVIPWAECPTLLWVVSVFGVAGATLFVCMLSGYIAFLSMQKSVVALCGLCLFCMCGIVYRTAYQLLPLHYADDRWYNHVGTVTKPIIACADQAAACRLVRDYVDHALCMCTEPVVGVVFPESCFYAWSLCADSVLAEYMPVCHGSCDYIIGSFYDDHGQYRNSCYWLRNGILQKRFDKRHAMPLIERLPWWMRCKSLQRIFFATMPEIVPSTNDRPIMQLGDTRCVPYICSELFFNRVPDDTHADLPIVALVNDRWAKPYLQQLMYLGAVVQAHAWQREILYVSYMRFLHIRPL